VATETLDFMRRELRTPEGGFAASLDADSEGGEGLFYIWTMEEMEAAGDAAALEVFRQTYDLPPSGNFEGRWILRRPPPAPPDAGRPPGEEPGPQVDEMRARLLDVRSRRVRPAIDDKVITAWNGLALSAWCTAARALNRPGDLTTAQELADFLLTALRPAGRLKRTFRLGQARHPAGLDDHAALGEGLLDLYQVDFDSRWLRAAIDQAETIVRDFADPNGGFFDAGTHPRGLPIRPKFVQDTPIPSGNSLAASLLLRLEAITGQEKYRQAALPAVIAMQATAVRYPTAFSGWLANLGLAAEPLPQLAIVGDAATEAFHTLAREAHSRFLPRLVLAGGDPEAESSPPLLRGRTLLGGQPAAYLCRGFVCDKPTASPDEMRRQLAEAR
jgi:uncharacterized protein YyaL (SSP411 family)